MIINRADRLGNISEYYFSAKLREVRELEATGRKIYNLGIGSPDLPPDPSIIQELARQADNPNNHGYNSYQGLPAFHEAVRVFYETHYGVQRSDSDQVLPLLGSKEAITHISLAYLNEGDEVLIPALGYPTYSSVTRMVGAKPIYYPLLSDRNWEPDWDFLENLNCERVKIMWLNYPHMPTGTKGSSALFEKFVSFAKKKDVLLCHDNPYSFIQNPEPASIFSVNNAREVALELNSLSKTFNMAGWRVGWLLGNSELIRPVLQIKSNMDSGMFKPVQLAAVKALKLGDNWFAKLNEVYARRRQLVFRLCDRLNCTYSREQAGMFVWAKVGNDDGKSLADRLLYEKNIFVAPGFIFGDAGNDYIRISLCVPESVLQEVLDLIEADFNQN